MKKRIKKDILVVLIFSLIASTTIVSILNLISKQTKENLYIQMAETNLLKVGDENIWYVDLTKKPEDYQKILEKEESTKAETEEKYESKQQENNETNKNEEEPKDNVELSEKIEKEEKEFESKTIIVKTPDITTIKECGKAQSIIKVSSEIYCIKYENETQTEEGYNILKQCKDVQVSKDEKMSLLDNEEDNLELSGITGNNYNWGTISTGLYYYAKKVNCINNANTVKVAVLDSGVLATHEVFADENTSDRLDLTYAYNYVNNNTNVTDNLGHGTKVAGTIAQSTSKNVKIVPIKVTNGTDGSVSDIITALAAIKGKVDIVNLSMGSKESDLVESRGRIEEVLRELYNSGTIVVCATGNEGEEEVFYPASSNYTIAVSAVGIYENVNEVTSLAYYSNYGNKVDFSAPGSAVRVPSKNGNTDYVSESGTSFATPLITAGLALIKSEKPEITVEQAKTELQKYCYDLGETGKDKYFGYGCLDFSNTMFSKPVTIPLNISNNWSRSTEIKVVAICNNTLIQYGKSRNVNIEPEVWKNCNSNIFTYTLEIPENGEYYIWFKDNAGNKVAQKVEIQHVDSRKPEITEEIKASNIDETKFKVDIGIKDQDSGISKIIWYYKKNQDTNYTEVTDIYENNGVGETIQATKSHIFQNLNSNTEYSVYAEVFDMVQNKETSETITVKTLENLTSEERRNRVVSNNYIVEEADLLISRVKPMTTVNELKQKISCEAQYTIIDVRGNSVGNNQNIGTGYKIRLENGKEYQLSVLGDLNGDALISTIDVAKIQKIAIGLRVPTKLEKTASDFGKDNKIDITDVAKLQKLSLGLEVTIAK